MSNQYRDSVLRTCNPELSQKDKLTNSAMGLVGEAGEVCDLIKKYLFHDQPLDREALIKELGDVRWYFELLCHQLNISIEDVERLNVEKLKKRYPNGFKSTDSIAKKDER